MSINILHIFAANSGSCVPKGGNFFGLPTWYAYLPGQYDAGDPTNGIAPTCVPALNNIANIWLIVAAVVEILLRIAAFAAVAFIVMGGIQFITAQGEADKAARALKTVYSALVGLVIAVASAAVVTFVAGSFTK